MRANLKGRARAACLLLGALLLSACLPSVTPTPLPSPAVLQAQASASVMDLKSNFYECARRQNLALDLSEDPGGPPAGLLLRWGPPPGWDGYAAVLGYDELVVVVHPSSTLDSISLEDLRAIFSGSLRGWAAAGWEQPPQPEIHPWGYPAGSDVRQAFESLVLEQAVPEGSFYLAPGPQELRSGVAEDTAAIGFLPRRWLDGQVKALSVEELDPSSLRMPVLALSPAEPGDLAAGWLACVQEQAFQNGEGQQKE